MQMRIDFRKTVIDYKIDNWGKYCESKYWEVMYRVGQVGLC